MIYRYRLRRDNEKNSRLKKRFVQGVKLSTGRWHYSQKREFQPFVENAIVEEQKADLMLDFMRSDREYKEALQKLDTHTKTELQNVALQLGFSPEDIERKKKAELVEMIRSY